jgi:inosine/xanthosine triphosphate pyrophosphatase family protein
MSRHGGGLRGRRTLVLATGNRGKLEEFASLLKTMAELGLEEKNRISHRAHAVAALRPILRSLSE